MTLGAGAVVILLTLLAILLALAGGLLVLAVVVSFTVAWYERVSQDPAVSAQRRHALALRLMFTELGCLFLTLLLRPFGWLPARLGTRAARRPPVILLHGLFQNRSCLLPLQWRLRAAGYDRVVSINTPAWRSFEQLVDAVATSVASTCQATGAARVHLVGHSMGGILARCYLQQRDGAAPVAACVTIGSPHHGSKLAPFAVSKLGRELLPNSQLLARLNSGPLPAGVQFTAIYSRHDNIIVPVESARLEGADNVELSGLGHTALLFSSRTAAAVVAALRDSEPVTKKP